MIRIKWFVGSLLLLSYLPFSSLAETYEYDERGRLVSVTSTDKTKEYVYDKANNIIGSETSTGGGNSSPSCSNSSTHLAGVPTYASPVTITLDDDAFLSLCTDADNDNLVVTSPSTPKVFTVASGQTVNVPYSVSDGRGGVGQGQHTFSRP